MAVSKKVANDMLRAKYVEKLIEAISAYDSEEVMLRAKSNEIAIPTVDCNGDDSWVVFVVKVPTGSNKGKDAYDGYEMAQEYIMKTEEKERKAKEKEKKANAKKEENVT